MEAGFLPSLVADALVRVERVGLPSAGDVAVVERYLALFVDLLAQLPTRRFFHLVLDDAHFLLRCQRCPLALASPFPTRAVPSDLVATSRPAGGSVLSPAATSAGTPEPAAPPPPGKLFTQLLDMLRFYAAFAVDDQTAAPVTEGEASTAHYAALQTFQRLLFKHFAATSRDLRDAALAPVGAIDAPAKLLPYLAALSDAQLLGVTQRLRLLPPPPACPPLLPAAAPALPVGTGASVGGVKRGRSAAEASTADTPAATAAAAAAGAGGASVALAVPPRIPPPAAFTRHFVNDVLLTALRAVESQLAYINRLPLYPSERLLWDANAVPSGRAASAFCWLTPTTSPHPPNTRTHARPATPLQATTSWRCPSSTSSSSPCLTTCCAASTSSASSLLTRSVWTWWMP